MLRWLLTVNSITNFSGSICKLCTYILNDPRCGVYVNVQCELFAYLLNMEIFPEKVVRVHALVYIT